MKTELCLRAHGNYRVLGSVLLLGNVSLGDAVRTSQATALAAIAYPHHDRPFVAADHGCYWTRHECR